MKRIKKYLLLGTISMITYGLIMIKPLQKLTDYNREIAYKYANKLSQ